MPSFGRFFLPGPTEVHPDVLGAMTRPVIGHRGDALRGILAEVQPGLRELFGTDRPVYVVTASGTGLMEAAVRGGVRRRALCLVNGAFSRRFARIVARCGLEPSVYEVPWGEAHDPDEVERRLRSGGFDAVTAVHSETSTGALNPLAGIAEAVRTAERATGDEILLLVDGVTSVGGTPVDAAANRLDFILTGSQKALAMPPGLSFGTASERLLARAATLPNRGFYLDPLELERYAARNQTPTTPAVSLIYALSVQMERILREGVETRFARHRQMAERCHAWTEARADRFGLSVLAPPAHRSPTVTTILLPEHRAASAVVASLAARGFTIAPGYGEIRERALRVGHMGDHAVGELDELLEALDEALEEAWDR